MKRIVDIFFTVTGKQVPLDHGYALFSAASRILESPDDQWLHGNLDVGFHLIRGAHDGHGKLLLSDNARLGIRMPVELLPKAMKLAGKRIELDDCPVRVGVSRSVALIPAATLYARIVTTKNGEDVERFDAEIQRQLEAMEIHGKPLRIPSRYNAGNADRNHGRRVFRVGNKTIVGYSMLVTELTAEESIRLQEKGIGGRRRVGCGVFLPGHNERNSI